MYFSKTILATNVLRRKHLPDENDFLFSPCLQVRLINQWASYTDFDGTPLRLRPHWAKENPKEIIWNGETYSGTEYLKMIYKEQFREFRTHLEQVCVAGGYEMQELKETFGNYYLDNVLEDVWKKNVGDGE